VIASMDATGLLHCHLQKGQNKQNSLNRHLSVDLVN